MIEQIKDEKVLVLGLSKSGVSAAKFLKKLGAKVWLSEYSSKLDEDQQKWFEELKKEDIKAEYGSHSNEFINNASFAVVSPGIPPSSDIYKRLKEQNIEIISEIELAYLNTKIPFIAITGTNGKTTTTALTSYILEYANPGTAPYCGNIGLPPTTLLMNNENIKYLVCEVSSYQAQNSPTFRPLISVFMNFTPDHISWHGSLENYFEAKAKLFAKYKKPAYAILNALDEKVCSLEKNFTQDEVFYFGKQKGANCAYVEDDYICFKRYGKTEKIVSINEVQLVGEHNYQNIMCAIITAKILGVETNTIKEAVKSFKPLEHRCEYCGEVNGIKFYNDSKATNPESSIVAINSFENKTVTLIAGGRDKNTSLDEFCNSIKKYIKDVILIGEAAERFEQNLCQCGYNSIHFAKTLEEAIDKSIELRNEICLFSPACASFDMFKNFEQRGEVFKEYVKSKI